MLETALDPHPPSRVSVDVSCGRSMGRNGMAMCHGTWETIYSGVFSNYTKYEVFILMPAGKALTINYVHSDKMLPLWRDVLGFFFLFVEDRIGE